MTDHKCPLCGKDADVREPGPRASEIRRITCATCGTYFITEEAGDDIRDIYHEPHRRAMLSGVTRERSEQRRPITMCSTTYDPEGKQPIGVRIDEVLDTLAPRAVPEIMDRALLNLARKSRYFGERVAVDPATDYPLLFAQGPEVAHHTLQHMMKSGMLDRVVGTDTGRGEYTLTPDGWARTEELSRVQSRTRQAFVAMWFDPQLNEAYDKGIRAAIEDAGYEPMRVDMAQFNQKIDDYIIAQIRQSRFLVADVTEHRPAVYFEAGFAMGLGLPVIFTCHKDHEEQCNFDTRQYNHIFWQSPDDLREKLKNRIAATIV